MQAGPLASNVNLRKAQVGLGSQWAEPPLVSPVSALTETNPSSTASGRKRLISPPVSKKSF